MIKAVVFDMGGVIETQSATSERHLAFAASTIDLLAEHGIKIPDSAEEFARKLTLSDRVRKQETEETLRDILPLEAWADYYLKEYGDYRRELFPIADELCYRWNDQRCETYMRPGVVECMEGLRKQGIRMGVISNTLSRTYVTKKLCDYGLGRYLEYVLLSSVCGHRKPGTKIFDICQETMGLEKSEMAYVGDTFSRDVIGTRDAGWKLMIRVNHPQASDQVKERERKLMDVGYQPDHTIEVLPQVIEIIRTYNETCPDC